MIHYQATMLHNEKTFQALAHMQYDLFCKKNLVVRTVISIAAMGAGILNFSQWWGALLIVYGAYLTSSKYAQANHTANKIVKGIKAAGLDFPASRYLFRDQFGGYMIPKDEMGKEVDDFRFFVEQKCKKTFQTQIAPVFKLMRKIDSNQRKKRHS